MQKPYQKYNKKDMRRIYSRVRDSLSEKERKNNSLRISDIFVDTFALKSSQCFFIYLDYRSEVQTAIIIDFVLKQGGVVCVPAIVPQSAQMVAVQIKSTTTDLAPGFKGILEPLPALRRHCIVDAGKIDIAVIPGVVFDKSGGRIGYGGGYYDRFLQNDAPQALRVGLAYKLQIVSKIEMEHHDIFMDYIICEHSAYQTLSR